jgi:hypothetical protein
MMPSSALMPVNPVIRVINQTNEIIPEGISNECVSHRALTCGIFPIKTHLVVICAYRIGSCEPMSTQPC